MKKKWFVCGFLGFIFLIFMVQNIYAEGNVKSRFDPPQPKEYRFQLETGLSAYMLTGEGRDDWKMTRWQPFVKIDWRILKFLWFYMGIMVERTGFDYSYPNLGYIGDNQFSIDVALASKNNPIFEYGIRGFFFDRRTWSLQGYLQMEQMAPAQIKVEKANFISTNIETGDKATVNLVEDLQKGVEGEYDWRRYDVGLRFDYRIWEFNLYASLGYTWLNSNLKINANPNQKMNPLAEGAVKGFLPFTYILDENSVFGSVGTEFRIYDGFYLNLSGSLIPLKYTDIYYGLFSLIIKSDMP